MSAAQVADIGAECAAHGGPVIFEWDLLDVGGGKLARHRSRTTPEPLPHFPEPSVTGGLTAEPNLRRWWRQSSGSCSQWNCRGSWSSSTSRLCTRPMRKSGARHALPPGDLSKLSLTSALY